MLQRISDKLEDVMWAGISAIAVLFTIIGVLIMSIFIATVLFMLGGV